MMSCVMNIYIIYNYVYAILVRDASAPTENKCRQKKSEKERGKRKKIVRMEIKTYICGRNAVQCPFRTVWRSTTYSMKVIGFYPCNGIWKIQ